MGKVYFFDEKSRQACYINRSVPLREGVRGCELEEHLRFVSKLSTDGGTTGGEREKAGVYVPYFI